MHLLQQRVIERQEHDLHEYKTYVQRAKIELKLVTHNGLPSLKLSNFRGQSRSDWEDESCFVIVNENTVNLQSLKNQWTFTVQYISRQGDYLVVTDLHNREILMIRLPKDSNLFSINFARPGGYMNAYFSWSLPEPLMREHRKVFEEFISCLQK